MILEAAAPQWWSATATWRLLRCPASAAPTLAPVKPPGHTADNSGTLAHLALQIWIEAGDWSHPDANMRLQERFDEVAKAHGANLEHMPRAVVTRARLKSRGKGLAALVAGAADVRSELLLRDEEHHLFGVLDIAAPGPGGFIIDLKTGHEPFAELSPAIEHQMTFYAHLLQATYGMLPKRVIAFSLQRGPREIKVSSSAVAAFLTKVRAAQLSQDTVARPQIDICRFCPKRMTCQPHWDAVSAWEDIDAIEGEISSVEQANSGRVALLIGNQWVTGLPKSALPHCAEPGQFARAVRLRRRGGSTHSEWTASVTTRIHIMRTQSVRQSNYRST